MRDSDFAMSEKITVDRKEFESFLAENQKLIDRSQALLIEVDRLEKENMKLREEVGSSRAKLQVLESTISESDESLKRARSSISRLIEEADKRISK
jgi:predicted  nucleic acid-binding Zn-ribbon protein